MFGRYILTELNGRFVVTDSASSKLVIMNRSGQPADNSSPADMQYFGMALAQARQLAQDLNG